MRLAAIRNLHTPYLTGTVMMLVGLVLLGLGIWLSSLGGTFYYWIAGALLIAAGALLIAGRGLGLWVYAVLLAGTLIWSFVEAGFNGWQLLPRLLLPALLGLWLCVPWIWRRVQGIDRALYPVKTLLALSLFALLVLFVAIPIQIHQETKGLSDAAALATSAAPLANTSALNVPDEDWRFYGRTMRGERYSPLKQITPQNVGKLKLAWTFRTGDMPQPFETQNGREFNFENTPIKVGDALYICSPHRWIFKIDAATGKQIWKYVPKADTKDNEYFACRGVSYYQAPPGDECPQRIISTTADARLFALNAETGQPCANFGDAGFVSLKTNMGEVPPGFHFITSPPLVVMNRIILGGWIYDNQAKEEPSGVVRAFDATNGRLAWAWDIGRMDPTAPLGPNEIYTRGTPNGWGVYTADPELGLVFVPLGNATPDYWGGNRRPFDEVYSSALVALDISTGKERWHFQTVHHDLWDFDLPIGPTLVDLPSAQGSVPALIQSTKLGQLFVLDRRTGQPLTEVTEQPAPKGPAPGDYLSPTQPQSVGMPSLTPAMLKESDLWGATPIDQLWCRIQFRKHVYKGPFTPPSLQGGIAYPAFDGVVDWYGVTVDPIHNLMIANSSYIPFTVRLYTQQDAMKKGYIKPWGGWGSDTAPPKPKSFAFAPQYGTPYAAQVKPWLNPIGVPCNAPPWGKLTAIDLNTRKIRWQRTIGTTADTGPFNTHFNLPLPTGIFNIGGNIVTASGLIFIGATADQYLRAFDESSGEQLWQARLPAGGQATPMTYMVNGKQYVVIAAGGHGGLRTKNGDYMIAYALGGE